MVEDKPTLVFIFQPLVELNYFIILALIVFEIAMVELNNKLMPVFKPAFHRLADYTSTSPEFPYTLRNWCERSACARTVSVRG